MAADPHGLGPADCPWDDRDHRDIADGKESARPRVQPNGGHACGLDSSGSSNAFGIYRHPCQDRTLAQKKGVRHTPLIIALQPFDEYQSTLKCLAITIAVDAFRDFKLQSKGYNIFTQKIPGTITPKNRLLMGAYIG